MSDTLIDEFLEHYGVKGMKWGIRNAGASGGLYGRRKARRAAEGKPTRKAARKDKKWQKNVYSLKGAVAVHNHVADTMNSQLPGLNARHPKADIRESVQSKATRAYIREYESMQLKGYEAAVRAVHGTSPSGSYRARYVTDSEGHRVVIEKTDAQHAETDNLSITIELEVEGGHIVRALNVRDEMTQSDFIDEFLEHYGVKGMKWGVRKGSGGRKGSRERTTFKKSPKKLSLDELKSRINRMETEQKYNKLNQQDKSEGRKIANEILTDSGKRVAKTVLTGAALAAAKAVLTAKFGEGVAGEVTRRLK